MPLVTRSVLIALVGLTAHWVTPQELSRRAYRARVAELKGELKETRPEKRRAAVRALVELGGVEGWRLVLTALGDPDASVGDAAQLGLAGLQDAKLIAELCGRAGLESREARAAERAAEAVGRLEVEVDGELLARRLSTREGELSRLLLRSLERQHAAGRLGGRIERVWSEVVGLLRSRRERALSARALVCLAALDYPEVVGEARAAALDREGAMRASALLALERAGSGELLAVARARAGDEEACVRAVAGEALLALRSRAALEVLVERLASEPRLGLRTRLVEGLQGATGFAYRTDPRPWRLLVEHLPEDWDGRPLRPVLPPPANDVQGRSLAQGPLRIPVESDRVAFLFDFSGSMWTALADGRSPKDIVAARLREALERLDESTHFNLVPYANEPVPWQARLVEAKARQVHEALEFFEACAERGKGNLYDAALLALADSQVDRIVILTDGVPTGGVHCDVDLVIELLEEHNLLRRVVFDVVLVDAPWPKVRRWRAFAERSGGRAIEVALENG